MIERHLVKLRARDEVSNEEEAAIRALVSEQRDIAANQVVVAAKTELNVSILLLDGIMARYKDLSDGQRQITELHVAGDFADLHSFTLKRLDHSVMTMTRCRIGVVPHERLAALTERYPHLMRLYWFTTNLDAAIHREWELSLGRRSALARLAALFCELQVRLGIVGLATPEGYDLPLTQIEVAECLGLTSVHVNRTLRDLRDRGLATFRSGRVTILDWEGLQQLAEFDPAYLYLDRRRH